MTPAPKTGGKKRITDRERLTLLLGYAGLERRYIGYGPTRRRAGWNMVIRIPYEPTGVLCEWRQRGGRKNLDAMIRRIRRTPPGQSKEGA